MPTSIAIDLLTASAERGDAAAQYELAVKYDLGHGLAVDKAKACITTHAHIKGGDPQLHAKMLAIDAEREAMKAKAAA